MVAGVTLDAGALIAAERNDRSFWTWWKLAQLRDTEITIPAPVITQVWRGASNARIAHVIKRCRVHVIAEPLARKAGMLCGKSGHGDAVDALVVAIADELGDTVLTSDPNDLRLLAQHALTRVNVIVMSDLNH